MAAQTGLVVIKEFQYRGETEQWTNKYWFVGPVPQGEGGWRSLFDAVCNVEKNVYSAEVTIVGGYGYDDNRTVDPATVWGVDLRNPPNTVVPGTLPIGTGEMSPGDCAVFAWWKTTRRNKAGKPVFLRKYFHDARNETGAPHDEVAAVQATALQTFADALSNTTVLGGYAIAAQGHPDEELLQYGHSPWITTRTLKRRGKRKKAETPSSSELSSSEPSRSLSS